MVSKFKKIYFNEQQLSEKEKQSSRLLSVFEGCSARTILTLTSGAYIVGYAKYLGTSDSTAALISAIPVLSGIAMLISPRLFETIRNHKPLVAFLCFLGRVLLGTMILVPIFINSVEIRLISFVMIYFIANFLLSFTYPGAQSWIQRLTPDAIKGKYFGSRESYVLLFVAVVTLLAGRVLDILKNDGLEFQGFLIIYLLIFLMAIVNFVFLSLMKESPIEYKQATPDILSAISVSLRFEKYRASLILITLWNFSYQLSFPFTSVLMVSKLKLDYAVITCMCVTAAASSFIFVRLWGRIADKKTWFFVMKLMVLLQMLSFMAWFFTNESNYMLMIFLAQLFNGAAIAGVNISILNIQFIYSPKENKTVHLGFSSALSSVCGFVGTVVGTWLLKLLQKVDILSSIGSGEIKVIFCISLILLGICVKVLESGGTVLN